MNAANNRLPVPDFVRLHARARPNDVALVDASTREALSYRELNSAIAKAAAILRSRGVRSGDRVAALARNSVELVILQLACVRAGAILSPMNWRLSEVELEALLSDCEPALLFGDELLAKTRSSVPRIDQSEFRRELATAAESDVHAQDASAPALMLYTSGTCGKPKGVLLSEANLFATAVNFTVLGEVSAESAFLVDAPMFHVIGTVTNIRPALMVGGKVVVSGGFDPAVTLERLADRGLGITHYFCVPQMADMLRSVPNFDPRRLRGLKALFTGGAPHPAAKIRAWLADGVAVVDGYGMTEAGTVLGMPLSLPLIEAKAGSAGLMPPTVEQRIVDREGRECEVGKVGELQIRGPNIFSGYWRKPEETERAFTSDGFFATGDLVRRDEDGFYYIVERKKDMFISGGENVYPAEIEAVLNTHPDVCEAAVVGVADSRWGEVGHAFVVLRTTPHASSAELSDYCEQRLARYKVPKAFHVLSALPRTGSGKVVKGDLRNLAQADQ